MKFKLEKEFQISLGRTLKEMGFDVYLDRKICELPTFKGDKEKPDLLVFFKKDHTNHKMINLSNPFAIECKLSNKFNEVTKAIIQIKKYFGKRYKVKGWEGEISNILFTSDLCFYEGKMYNWSLGNKDFNEGLNWGLIHVLFSLGNKSGVILKENDEILIRFHNCNFKLDFGGIINRPNKKAYHPISETKKENEWF